MARITITIDEPRVCGDCPFYNEVHYTGHGDSGELPQCKMGYMTGDLRGKTFKRVKYKGCQLGQSEMGSITDAEIDTWGRFTDHEKNIIKEQYAAHKKGFFPNPLCALR